jgi:hypothetical protein
LQAGGRQFEPDQLHQNSKGDENPLFNKINTSSPKRG